MNDAARAAGIPLIGHAPNNLGIEALLEQGQALAHVGNLSNVYFFPVLSNMPKVWLTAGSVGLLLVALVGWLVATLVRAVRKTGRGSDVTWSLRRLGMTISVFSAMALVAVATTLPTAPLHESVTVRVGAVGLTVLLTLTTALYMVRVARARREAGLGTTCVGALVSVAALILIVVMATFWLPISWRGTDEGIARLAERLREAGVVVQTTLINAETLGPSSRDLQNDPVVQLLHPEARDLWLALPVASMPGYGLPAFQRRVTSTLHQKGVTLVAGTDAMGLELVPPGSSLHRELSLLVLSGLSPYEAIRTATINAAAFLKREDIGAIAVGRHADVVLVGADPFADVANLSDIEGVMVRGVWLDEVRLDQMLETLRP
jgi:hypothetical protein